MPASLLSPEMILLGISSSKHLVSLNGGFSELLGLVGKLPKEDLRATCWLLITLLVDSQLRTLSSNTPAGTQWEIIHWAFGLCTYLVIHDPVKLPSFRLPEI